VPVGFDAAEEALRDAFAAAFEQCPSNGLPANRYASLVSIECFKTIDRWQQLIAYSHSIVPGGFDAMS
jgi:RNA polymerase sigma-70 factor (ECF subfamily)